MALHLIKLSVGTTSLDDLRRRQSGLADGHPKLRHLTRQMPRRAAEIVSGGSIYWVIAGLLTARQRVTEIVAGTRADGTVCAALILDPELIPVRGGTVRPFQGWRYLSEADAPADLTSGQADGSLPEHLRRELTALALI